MSNEKLVLLSKTCSFLSNIIDCLELCGNSINSYDLTSANSLLQLMSSNSEKIKGHPAPIPQLLRNIFMTKKTEACSDVEKHWWYFCDICKVSTRHTSTWLDHMVIHGTTAHELHFVCDTCGIHLYGLSEKVNAYFESSVHNELHAIYSSEHRLWYCCPPDVWKEIEAYSIVKFNGNKSATYNSIQNDFQFFADDGFISKKPHSFETLFAWIDFCFPSKNPKIVCGLCNNVNIVFTTVALWNHLTNSQHQKTSQKTLKKKGFLLCLVCENVFINHLSILQNHTHKIALGSKITSSVNKDNISSSNFSSTKIIEQNHCKALTLSPAKKLDSPQTFHPEKINSAQFSQLTSTTIKSLKNSPSVEMFKTIKNSVDTKTKPVLSFIGVLKYLFDRYSKEAFCLCCPTVYFCSVCNFICLYLPYWEKHLSQEKHKSCLSNDSDYILTKKCESCGLVMYIERNSIHLLELSLHLYVDDVLGMMKRSAKDYFLNCMSYQNKSIKNNSSILSKIPHHPLVNCCREDCKLINSSPTTFVTVNFTLDSLLEQFDGYFNKFYNIGPQNLSIFNFTCYICKISSAEFSVYRDLINHMANSHWLAGQHHHNFLVKTPISRPFDENGRTSNNIAIFCSECFHLLIMDDYILNDINNVLVSNEVVNKMSTPEGGVPNVCMHSAVLKSFQSNNKATNLTILKKCYDTTQSELNYKDDHLTFSKMKLRFKLIFEYLMNRYSKEPFCHDCGTYYYCIPCNYGTSYMIYWKNHLSNLLHVKKKDCLSETHHCSDCGLTLFTNKFTQQYCHYILKLDYQHEKVDKILKEIIPKNNDFLANCKDDLSILKKQNLKFIDSIYHSKICKEGCNFLIISKASEVCEKEPFILTNFNIASLSRYLDFYMARHKWLNKGKMICFCIDCEKMFSCKLHLEKHLIEQHDITQLNCLYDGECWRTAIYCCVCNALMISLCRHSINKISIVKSTNKCNHSLLSDKTSVAFNDLQLAQKTILCIYKLIKHLSYSKIRCSYLKKVVTYFCCSCKIKFETVEELCAHILLPVHSTLYKNMVVFICEYCIKINICSFYKDFDPINICGGCKQNCKLVKLYKELKKKSAINGSIHDGSKQMKFFTDLRINCNFIGSTNSTLSFPVLSSSYELYDCVVSIPEGSRLLSSINSILSSSTFFSILDVSLSSMMDFLNSRLQNHSDNYHCCICDEFLKSFDSFTSHLVEKKHVFNCYLSAGSVEPIPMMAVCNVCSLIMVSDSKIDFEQHYDSPRHIKIFIRSKYECSTKEYNALFYSSLTEECLGMFKSQKALEQAMVKHKKKIDETSMCYPKIKDRLCYDILKVLLPKYPNVQIYCFGSRESGMATMNCDIDVFVDLDRYYSHECKRVKSATIAMAAQFQRNHRYFDLRRTITRARVPVIKLWHRSLCVNVDINCVNAHSTENTKLNSFYLMFDERCKWLVMVVKEWAKTNYLINVRNGFNSYTVMWMVFFFLMQPHINILPNVLFLKKHFNGVKTVINGWPYCFTLDRKIVKENFKTKSLQLWPFKDRYKLLYEFFHFYCALDTSDVFLCPLTGNLISKSIFTTDSKHIYRNSKGVSITDCDFSLNKPIIFLDPIVLDINLTRNISESIWELFNCLCMKTCELLSWS